MGILRSSVDTLRTLLEGSASTLQGERVKIASMFGDSRALLVYFPRRFGCPLCRNFMKGVSDLKDQFEAMGVRMVAIGFDEKGVDEFVAGNYWNADLYLDKDKELHKQLQFKRGSILDMFKSKLWALNKEAKKNGITGNFKGDGFQLGGTYLITREKLLYSHVQATTVDYMKPEELLAECTKAMQEEESA